MPREVNCNRWLGGGYDIARGTLKRVQRTRGEIR